MTNDKINILEIDTILKRILDDNERLLTENFELSRKIEQLELKFKIHIDAKTGHVHKGGDSK